MARAKLSADWDYYIQGGYMIENNVWNKGRLVNGVDYSQSISYDSTDLTHDITFNWSWPHGDNDVKAYPEISVGKKPYWDWYDPASVCSTVNALGDFEVSYDVSVASGSEFRNISFDLWLTDEKFGDEFSITSEVMVWIDSDGIDPWGRKVGTITMADGDTASIFQANASSDDRSWSYLAVVFDEAQLVENMDLRLILQSLASRKLIDGNDYVSGFEFGAEIAQGKGSFTINSIDYTMTGLAITAGNDTILGSNSADRVDGLAGDDTIDGRGGSDRIIGNAGFDTLAGGTGEDRFIFRGQTLATHDTITDFETGIDDIVMRAGASRHLNAGTLADNRFSDDGVVTSATRIIFDRESGDVYFDRDGSGSTEAKLLFHLDNGADLQASDFLVA